MVNVKISAHSNDNNYKIALESALKAIEVEGKIHLIGEIGENPFAAFEEEKEAVELLVVLLSPDYLSDDSLEQKDILPILVRKSLNSKCYWVQPVLLQACDYSSKPYGQYPAFPIPTGSTAASPIKGGIWPSEQAALDSVLESIKLGAAYIESYKNSAPKESGEAKKHKILLLTSNPKNTQSLDLNVEINTIKSVWKRSSCKDQFEVELCLDVTKTELLETLLQERPMVVHFSGHGTGQNGLLFYGEKGEAEAATGEGLANLFRLFKDSIQCVLLNACYSQDQATIISQHIPYVVGTDNAISDSRAIKFSEGFYMALFNGEPIEQAYQIAIAHVDFQNLPPNARSVLFKAGEAVNASSGQLVTVATDENMRGTLNPTEEKVAAADSWTDIRDGQVYKTVKIGEQTWLAENFRYAMPGALDTKNPLYGCFYNWEQAMQACPEGWHLPSKDEWDKLVEASGGKYAAGNALKSADGWHNDKGGKKTNGFNAYPAGEYQDLKKDIWNQTYYVRFWVKDDLTGTTYHGERLAWYVKFAYLNEQVLMDRDYKEKLHCVRYVKG